MRQFTDIKEYKEGDQPSASDFTRRAQALEALLRSGGVNTFVDSTGLHIKRSAADVANAVIEVPEEVDIQPMAWWSLRGHTKDATENNNAGTLTGAASVDAGVLDTEAGGGMEVNNDSSISLEEQVSVSAWFRRKQNGAANGDTILVKVSDSASYPNYILDFHSSGGKIRWYGYEGTTAKGITSGGASNCDDGYWHHAHGTFDGTTWKLYIDGKEDGSATDAATLRTGTGKLTLGTGAGGNFAGMISDVRVFNQGLPRWMVNRVNSQHFEPRFPIIRFLHIWEKITLPDGVDIVLGTINGSVIATTTSQKLGFWGVTPVDQPAAVGNVSTYNLFGSDHIDYTELEDWLTTLESAINQILARLRESGLIAT